MKTRSRNRRPSRDALAATRDEVVRRTSAVEGTLGGIRIDWNRLEDGETVELVALTNRVDGLDLDERRRWEELVGRAAGQDGLFSRLREARTLRREMASLLARAQRAPARRRLDEPGSILIPRQWCFEWLNELEPILHIPHLGVLVFVLGQIENGIALVPQGRIEDSGDDAALVIDRRLGIGAKFDPDQRLRWKEILDHLDVNGVLRVERHGAEVWVRRGSRVLAENARRENQKAAA